jgi:hypothetical protein
MAGGCFVAIGFLLFYSVKFGDMELSCGVFFLKFCYFYVVVVGFWVEILFWDTMDDYTVFALSFG